MEKPDEVQIIQFCYLLIALGKHTWKGTYELASQNYVVSFARSPDKLAAPRGRVDAGPCGAVYRIPFLPKLSTGFLWSLESPGKQTLRSFSTEGHAIFNFSALTFPTLIVYC